MIKQILIIILFLSNIDTNPFITPPTAGDVIKANMKGDPAFRFCIGKTMIANGVKIYETYNSRKSPTEKFCAITGNAALLAIAVTTAATYPNESWNSYNYILSENKTKALKIATIITIINVCTNRLSPEDEKIAATLETLFSVYCCLGPLIITATPNSIKFTW